MLRRLWVLPVVFGLLALSACSISVSTANLSDVKTGEKLKGSEVAKEVNVFSPDAPEIFASAKLNNAPDGTKLTFTWRYLEKGGLDIDKVTVVTENGQNVANSSLSKPTRGWPVGDYEAVLKLGTQNSKPIHVKFKVK